jgi:hypothetical protein
MIGTLTALQWFIYDGVKVALSIPRPPPIEMPEPLKKKLGEKLFATKETFTWMFQFNSILCRHS